MSLARKHYQIRELLSEQGVTFCYSGMMTEAILTSLGDAIKYKLTLEEADTNTIRGVFAIFVEQMQNTIRYSAEREESETSWMEKKGLSYGTLTVGRDEEKFFVTCGNKVQQKDVPRLREQLTLIQGLDRDGLKRLYKKILQGDTPATSQGAGVGFVDIAKRASRPIEFDFFDLDEHYAFFSLKATI
ncbi:MAG: SiaB family protein kinase [Magnetococcus sp. DMHC-6]